MAKHPKQFSSLDQLEEACGRLPGDVIAATEKGMQSLGNVLSLPTDPPTDPRAEPVDDAPMSLQEKWGWTDAGVVSHPFNPHGENAEGGEPDA